MADGSVIIVADVDDKAAQRELNSLAKKIDGLKAKIEQSSGKKMAALEQAQQLGVELDNAKAKLAEMQEAATGQYSAEQIEAQKENVRMLQTQWNAAQSEVEKYDRAIATANDQVELAENRAGELAQNLATGGEAGSEAGDKISAAMEAASKRVEKLGNRIIGLAKRVFVFTLITKALRGVREYFWQAIKTSDEATAAMARLKGALQTLAQPIVQIIIPAFTALINILTQVVSVLASFLSKIFGTTAAKSAESAKQLNKEKKAIGGVGSAAKEATKSLAGFDEINQLAGENAGGGGGGGASMDDVDFSGVLSAENWLDNMLAGVEKKVTLGLLLGGIALIAFGAAMGNLSLVLAGLLLLGAGLAYGYGTGVITDWAKALGLDRAEEFVTAALLIAGMAFIVIGIILGNAYLVFAGALMLGAGIAYGKSQGVFSDWAKKLGLDSVFDYVTTAIMLGGIALVAIGAAMSNLPLAIAGLAILGVGIAAQIIGEQRLEAWWEVLRLTTVQQWVGVTMLLAGIAMVAIGVALRNIKMVLVGMGLIGLSTAVNTENNNLQDWVKALGLEKVVGWVTTALLLGGIGLVVIGLVTGNISMFLLGLGMLGAGISVGVGSGTFKTWLDKIEGAFRTFKGNILTLWGGLWSGINGFISKIVGGLKSLWSNTLTISRDVSREINNTLRNAQNNGVTVQGKNYYKYDLSKIPRMADGGVIPANREFLAVLGDQKSGTNIETPLSTMIEAFRQALGESGGGTTTVVVNLDGREIARNTVKHVNSMARAQGTTGLLR